MPPFVNIDQVKGMAASMAKLMLNGKFAERVDTTNTDLKYLRELL
jgi:pyruvate dehydrogenase (quinone)